MSIAIDCVIPGAAARRNGREFDAADVLAADVSWQPMSSQPTAVSSETEARERVHEEMNASSEAIFSRKR